ncbi:TPA: magnesium chelatase [candidate division WWE3 bacterium]|nr:MAG: hypothetical protein UW65_C0002G0011 [candidate division WWE3 bacterium GW2011_GWB1_44_4]OGC51328.1 MAG: hypothetical protein A2709_01330 [candidate division WWE3 bacterium RIFCSPHIGHO2_01_FULL_43_9]HAZ29164.1 magnesium chelatase [candidate division WWE3 bacterium]
MLTKVKSAYFFGTDAFEVDVEVNILERCMPGFEIVGLAGREVAESRERVKNAILNAYGRFPYDKKIVVNLAPADIPKEGSYYDLSIAAGILSLTFAIQFPCDSAFFGEVSMDGQVRKTRGAYLFGAFAKAKAIKNLFVPSDCYQELSSIKDVTIYPISNLSQLANFADLKAPPTTDLETVRRSLPSRICDVDFCDILGQDTAKRALVISAAGGHSILLSGSPGSGKSMLAKALRGILPDLREYEVGEVAKIYSASGFVDDLIVQNLCRPFRSPHHTISYSGMVGGGSVPKPGEISLAHKGVLFLDEMSEFQPSILECLRQPMEDGFITISRSKGSVRMPCEFTLVGCTNPCPCGFFGDPKNVCKCSPPDVARYKKRLSGPILDRIDIFLRIHNPAYEVQSTYSGFMGGGKAEKVSDQLRARVEKARAAQELRLEAEHIGINARMTNDLVKKYCVLDHTCSDLLERAVYKLALTPRTVFKIIKVARTIADLDEALTILPSHLAEAIQYKCI